ncbi:MAG: hypothetical protein PHR26_02195 [Candidatus ainarchaeum sp.]|nr:hypothetical protein [Candidatus ainarchaeum sp.]MDD3976199.1 hypothetical protein [Candidatus ainarchaeum sp.]
MKKKQKGYIGAIGDDLPSLIPIFIGLLIFFSVFLSTYNNYKTETQNFDLHQDAIDISMTLRSEPVIIDYNHFTNICNKVNTNRNWTAFLIDLPQDLDNYNEVDLEFLLTNDEDNTQIIVLDENIYDPNSEQNIFYCPNTSKNLDKFKTKVKTQDEKHKVLVYVYPINLQIEYHAVPVRLYVAVWE